MADDDTDIHAALAEVDRLKGELAAAAAKVAALRDRNRRMAAERDTMQARAGPPAGDTPRRAPAGRGSSPDRRRRSGPRRG